MSVETWPTGMLAAFIDYQREYEREVKRQQRKQGKR